MTRRRWGWNVGTVEQEPPEWRAIQFPNILGGRMLERASSIEGAKTTRGPYHKQSMVVFVFPTAAAHSKWKINFVPRTYRGRAPCLGAPLSGQVSCPKTPPHRKTFLRECLGACARPFECVVGGGGLCGSIEKRAGTPSSSFEACPRAMALSQGASSSGTGFSTANVVRGRMGM